MTAKTGPDGWTFETLWWMMRRREYWHCGTTWTEWRLSALYTWYDGPIFQVRVGPFWVCLSCI